MIPAVGVPPIPAVRQAIVPRATYRVQLHSAFRFDDAAQHVPYLADLGISHLYISPPLRARAGSPHGYDVVDHATLNPELGGRAGFDRLVAALHGQRMGLLVDIVPNHMGVLGGDPALAGKVLLPILGDQYGLVLERGELRLAFEAARGSFTLSHHAHRLPVDPTSYGGLLRRALRAPAAPGARGPPHARLHAQLAAPGAGRSGGLLPGLPHPVQCSMLCGT